MSEKQSTVDYYRQLAQRVRSLHGDILFDESENYQHKGESELDFLLALSYLEQAKLFFQKAALTRLKEGK